MSLIYLLLACFVGAGIATFLCKFPDWWAAREYARFGGPIQVIEVPSEPCETVRVGDQTFRIPLN